MDNPIYLQWQQWETRVQEWLNQTDDDLDLLNTTPFDRVVLTLLAVKYQVLYRDVDAETGSTAAKKDGECKSTVKLLKTKAPDATEKNERHRDKQRIFDKFTGHFLSSEQVSNETLAEWEEFDQLCKWHGLAFLQRLEKCLHRFVSELICITPAYQELIREPAMISPVTKINNQVYDAKNDGQIYLSIDIKSANFAMLQYIQAIDAQMYPTWPDFLSLFVGSRPLFVRSKKLRLYCLSKLPEVYKLEALWTHFTGTIYQKILCPCLDEKDVDARCMALSGDEVVFHLDDSIREEKVVDLVEHVQSRLTKETSIVKFVVQAYRIRTFHWKEKHMCFARVFIGQCARPFDLKCVPYKDKNYEPACADFRMFSGL